MFGISCLSQQNPRQLEALNFGLRNWIALSVHYLFSETKALNSGVVTDKLICVFVLHIQNQGCSFDHNTFSHNNNIYVTHITF